MNKSLLVSVIALVFIGLGVSRIKYEVVFLRKELKAINKKIEKKNDNIKVLKAEWNYLNSPDRLKKLAAKYFPEMKPIGVKQLKVYNKIRDQHLELVEQEKEASDKGSSISSLLDKVMGGNEQ